MGEPHGKGLGEAAPADLRLRLLDRIGRSSEGCPPRLIVNQQPRGARIAAPRLAHRAGVEEPAPGGEVGHWEILATLNERAGKAELRELADWAIPIQRRHFEEARQASLKLAAEEDPNETS